MNTAPPAPADVTSTVTAIRPTLATTFHPRENALNAMRLVLAVSVILWHSFPLTGTLVRPEPLRQLLGHVGVDGFFAISGFLITASWVRRPHLGAYLRARLLRIMPAFWVSLLVTALVLAPVGVLLGGGRPDATFWRDAATYVVRNAGLWVSQFDIAGTPLGVPYPEVWNGSMWTLFWEFCCYLAVLGLGLTTLLRRRWCVAALFVLMTVTVLATSYGPVDNLWLTLGSHFGLPFAAGAMVWRYQHQLPVRGRYLALAAVAVLLATLLPDYRVVAALPLAYLLLSLGALGRHPRLQVRQDISYGTYIYAFPVQQILALGGVAALGVPRFALLSLAGTLPLAVASWYLVEKPALRLKSSTRTPRLTGPRTLENG